MIHWATGANPVPSMGKIGMAFVYSQRFSGPVASSSKTTVISMPMPRNTHRPFLPLSRIQKRDLTATLADQKAASR